MSDNHSNSPRPVSAIDATSVSHRSHPSPTETNSLLSLPSPEARDQSPVVPLPAKPPGERLLEAL
jgi:hypothetical protein